MALSYGFCLGDEDAQHTAAQLSGAVRQTAGDGVCRVGGQLALTLSGFAASLSPGYVLAGGQWLKSDEPVLLTLPRPDLSGDRVDAIAACVDYAARTAAFGVLERVDPENLRALQTEQRYCMPLYLVRVRRGASGLSEEDVIDVREYVAPLSALTAGAQRAYRFVTSGIDREVARLLDLGRQAADRADSAADALNAAAGQAGGTAAVGELRTGRTAPLPAEEWVLCDGGAVPAAYPALSALLSGVLPDLSGAAKRYRTYIYAGPPAKGESEAPAAKKAF